MRMKLCIKNMVCPRCIMVVRKIFLSVGISSLSVALGEVETEDNITERQRQQLSAALLQAGFELLEDPLSQTVEQLRVCVIEWVRMKGKRPKMSDYLCMRLHKDFSLLSKLFREVQGMTIEHYAITHRVEYAKELLGYNQLTTSEIAYMLGYSSPAHFSSQFKQIAGMTPTMMRSQNLHQRIPLTDL